jgi:3'-phosphoadenosine 5'-phosphosulfate sulfotransferase (PAPS reductase)/FAD synthetase
VLFLETGYHFAATYEFRDRPTREWQLNLVNAAAKKNAGRAGIQIGHFMSRRSHKLLPVTQSGAAAGSPGTL